MAIKNEEKGYFKKGQSGNLKGRPKRWTSELRHTGYALSEINDCIQILLQMTEPELESAAQNPKCTVLELTVIKAIQRGIKYSSLYSIETLLSRVYGKPKENIQAELSVTKFDVRFNIDTANQNIIDIPDKEIRDDNDRNNISEI